VLGCVAGTLGCLDGKWPSGKIAMNLSTEHGGQVAGVVNRGEVPRVVNFSKLVGQEIGGSSE
jgi:hypothetical protein